MAYILALAHRMYLKDRLVREGRWNEKGDFLGTGLMGRTLGVIGVGNIGAEIFRLVQPFDMRLLGCDPNVPQSAVDELGVKPREVYQPLRVAVSGSTISPGIFESLVALGREETLARLDDALARLTPAP